MAKLYSALLLISFGIAQGLEWEIVPDDFVYACAGSNVVFPWRFKATETEKVINLHWVHDGALSSSIIASLVSDFFMATSAYAARARHVQNGGLVLESVSANDGGNYTIEVNVDERGVLRSFNHTVHLQVSDGTMLEGGQLRAEQEPEAWWDESSGQWFIRLTCGAFSFLGPPPLDVKWTTPEGETKTSNGYESGFFYLLLTTPARGGNYSCTIPSVRRPDICFEPNDDAWAIFASSAALAVDEMKARLSMLEANQKTLREENARLRANQDTLGADNERLVANQTNLWQDHERLMDKLQQLERLHVQDVENTTEICRDIEEGANQQMETLRDSQHVLQDRIELLWNLSMERRKTDLAKHGPCHPNNYTVINDTRRRVAGEYKGNSDMCDKRLQTGWYRFFLQKQNAVLPTTCVPENNCNTDASTWMDLQGQPLPDVGHELDARACSSWGKDCCRWHAPITVRNCGDYLVYKLWPLPACDLAYCVEPQE